MKPLIQAVALTVVLAAPVASFAQSEQPLTRAEVRAQLKQIEQAGYNPAVATDATYPADIQAAEARVAAQNATGYGSPATSSSQAGSNAPMANPARKHRRTASNLSLRRSMRAHAVSTRSHSCIRAAHGRGSARESHYHGARLSLFPKRTTRDSASLTANTGAASNCCSCKSRIRVIGSQSAAAISQMSLRALRAAASRTHSASR